jgi:prolyl-tRNA editing enzyme YbaK/EbsC (Cys-tRNA(Pro) deacylase)
VGGTHNLLLEMVYADAIGLLVAPPYTGRHLIGKSSTWAQRSTMDERRPGLGDQGIFLMSQDPFPGRTAITDLLDRKQIPYRLLPHSEPVFTVATAAAQRGVVKEEMVKSILLREKGHRRFVMACVTGESRVDLQAVRRHLRGEWQRLTFAGADEILQVTGCVQGAVTPLNLPEEVPIFFDEAIAQCVKVNISSGHPMAGLELKTRALIELAGARLAAIARRSNQ